MNEEITKEENGSRDLWQESNARMAKQSASEMTEKWDFSVKVHLSLEGI